MAHKLPLRPRSKRAFHDVMYAPTKTEAHTAIRTFLADQGSSCAGACGAGLDIPAPANPPLKAAQREVDAVADAPVDESPFATLPLRQRVTTGADSRTKGLLMASQLLELAQRRWRRLNGAHLLPRPRRLVLKPLGRPAHPFVRAGVPFVDGVMLERGPTKTEARRRPPDHADRRFTTFDNSSAKRRQAMQTSPREKAQASPTKAFFVHMITRDITLADSILDLIDNSVDGAWRHTGSQPIGLSTGPDLSPYRIHITATPQRFVITDNCRGITLDDAVNYAFTFGRTASAPHNDYSIGIYGIGMKRAAFKLGHQIHIRSTYTAPDHTRTTFRVPISVTEWLKDDKPPWDFDIEDAPPLQHDGVEIIVDPLTDAAKSSFDNPAFLQNLRRTIARDYLLHLNRGLTVSLNETTVPPARINLRSGTDFVPVRHQYEDTHGKDHVLVEIVGGMAAPPPEDIHPAEDEEGDKRFGWYVVCNGRIVLAADKTHVSGWGTPDWPQWHRQYSGFVGLIFFTSPNTVALPLTTTKRSIDTSSPVFARARARMRDISKRWIAYTNARKQVLGEAKAKEQQTLAVSIHALPQHSTVTLPTFSGRPHEPVANIGYSVPRSRMTKLQIAFGSLGLPYREVGLKSFNYAYDELVGDQ